MDGCRQSQETLKETFEKVQALDVRLMIPEAQRTSHTSLTIISCKANHNFLQSETFYEEAADFR